MRYLSKGIWRIVIIFTARSALARRIVVFFRPDIGGFFMGYPMVFTDFDVNPCRQKPQD